MKNSDYTLPIALTLLKGIGPKKARQLATTFDDLEEFFKDSYIKLKNKTGMPISFLKQMEREIALSKAKEYQNYFKSNNIEPIYLFDDQYPRRLKQCHDAPLLLYGKGKFELNNPKVVAIVGTRNATEYGKEVCIELIEGMIGKDILIVSGMAYGIDICVHQLCVKNNIPTIGVLGHGLDRLYPSVHKHTASRMLSNGGLISEFLPGTKPDRENFPMRNRIVAGMSDATIVVESKNSGGSLITAQLANDYNRDVFAVPGNIGQIYSRGCNELIKAQKAHLITSCQDFLTIMDWNKKENKEIQINLFQDLSQEERNIVEIIQVKKELNIDVLSSLLKIPISILNVQLFNLEISGILKSLPGKIYKLT